MPNIVQALTLYSLSLCAIDIANSTGFKHRADEPDKRQVESATTNNTNTTIVIIIIIITTTLYT